MPLTPADTKDTDIAARARDVVNEQPVAITIIALLLGFIVGSVIL